MPDDSGKWPFLCFHKGKRYECRADTIAAARDKAMKHWRLDPSQRSKVSVQLDAEEGEIRL